MSALSFLERPTKAFAGAIERFFFAPADARAYACLRIGYSVAVLCVLIDLWPVRRILFSSSGLFVDPAGDPGFRLSVFEWLPGETSASAILLVAAAAAVCLGLGILARASAAVVYLWAVSYAVTAPVAQSGFDTVLRSVGFVMVLCPAASQWTLFTPKRSTDAPPVYGLRLVQWQLALIYVSTVWFKAPDPFWRNGEAVTYFSMSMFARYPSPALAHMGAIGALFTYATLFIEAMVPLFLWVRKTRFLGLFLGFSLHAGVALVSKLGLFFFAMMPLYFAFLETADFERLARAGKTLRSCVRGPAAPAHR